MQVKTYIDGSRQLSLEEFLNFSEESAVTFDFLTQGEEADRTLLTNEIYASLFPWYDGSKYKGDTLNTYRTAIKQFYGQYYSQLDRETQLEILDIIKQYTPHNNEHLFEFDVINDDGTSYKQVSNNYQLGNFAIWPSRGGINPNRAHAPYNDYFDNMIAEVYDYYQNGLTSDNKLHEAMLKQSDYFNLFEDITDFVVQNYLVSFFEDDPENENSMLWLRLSECQNFSEYVQYVTQIITQRGHEIYNVLHNLKLNDENEKQPAIVEQVDVVQEPTDVEYLTSVEGVLRDLQTNNQTYWEEVHAHWDKYDIKPYISWIWIVAALPIGFLVGLFLAPVIDHVAWIIPFFGDSFAFLVGAMLEMLLIFWTPIYMIYKNIKTWRQNRYSAAQRKIGEAQFADKCQEANHKIYQSVAYKKYEVSFPKEFFNLDDVVKLYDFVTRGRARTLQQAFIILTEQKHYEKIENSAIERNNIEKERLSEQRMAADEQRDHQMRMEEHARDMQRLLKNKS